MRDYVENLISQGKFRIFEREVDPRFQLSAVTVLKGGRIPVVSNLFGGRQRLRELIGAGSSTGLPRAGKPFRPPSDRAPLAAT